MLITEEELYSKIKNRLANNVSDREWIQKTIKEIEEEYGYPSSITFGYFTMRNNLIEADEHLIYIIAKKLFNDVSSIYTKLELEKLSSYKYHTDKVSTIRLKALKINDNHFISSINTKDLILWGKNGLVNYNEKTQRPLKIKTANGFTYYRISINSNAIKQIQVSYENNSYVPNIITFNIPETCECYYDENTGELIIDNVNYLDILDGYHRYIALKRVHDANPNFNYKMELRLLRFSEEDARQFIWQEDQKTKMTKIESESLNQDNYGNQVAGLLDTGILKNYGNFIDKATFSYLINYYYFNDRKKHNRSELIVIKNEIYEKLTNILESKPSLMDIQWNLNQTTVIMHLIKTNNYSEQNYNRLIAYYEKIRGDNKALVNSDLRKLDNLYKEVL